MQAGEIATALVTLTNTTGTAGGTVTYTLYTNNTCTTTYTITGSPSTKTVSNSVAPKSSNVTFNTIGTFYWRGVYSGDTLHNAATSGCVALNVVNAAEVSIALTIAPDPVVAETGAVGSATLSGVTVNAGGTVTYSTYSDDQCTNALTISGSPSTVTVTNGVVPNSTPAIHEIVGSRYWRAVYSGDANNSAATSPCEEITVTPAASDLALSVSPNPVEAGKSATGVATLAHVTSTAGGSVTYTIYTNNTCSTQITPNQTSTVTVTNGVVPSSPAVTLNQIGTVYWRATYTGDANNNADTSPCVAVGVSKVIAAIDLGINPSTVTVWNPVSGQATLSGGTGNAGGTVTYTVYTDGDCSVAVLPAKQSTVTVTNAVVPASSSFSFDYEATLYWNAVYSGDANNQGDTSSCVEMDVVGGSLTASIAGATLPAVTYSEAAHSNSGTLVLTVTDQRGTAEGWSVTLTMSDFVYSGESPIGANIPAGNFRVTAAGAPTATRGQAVSGSGPIVPSTGATGPLDGELTVLTAPDGTGAGEYVQTLNVTLDIPARSQAGMYTAVVQTTTSSAP
jgi:hypothetical protein